MLNCKALETTCSVGPTWLLHLSILGMVRLADAILAKGEHISKDGFHV